MTFPTPGGITSLDSQLTGAASGLPANWQNQPTTQASFSEAVQFVTVKYGSQKGAQFQAWYTAAWRKDPKITPKQALLTWLTGTSVSGAVGVVGGVVGGIVNKGIPAVAKVGENLSNSVPNPLSGLAAIGDFFNRLTSPHTWLRVGEFIVGVGLLAIGLNALLKNPAGKIADVLPAGKIAKVMK